MTDANGRAPISIDRAKRRRATGVVARRLIYLSRLRFRSPSRRPQRSTSRNQPATPDAVILDVPANLTNQHPGQSGVVRAGPSDVGWRSAVLEWGDDCQRHRSNRRSVGRLPIPEDRTLSRSLYESRSLPERLDVRVRERRRGVKEETLHQRRSQSRCDRAKKWAGEKRTENSFLLSVSSYGCSATVNVADSALFLQCPEKASLRLLCSS
jgi:hypothetical protein